MLLPIYTPLSPRRRNLLEITAVAAYAVVYPIVLHAFTERSTATWTAVDYAVSIPLQAARALLLWIIVKTNADAPQPTPTAKKEWAREVMWGIVFAIVLIVSGVLMRRIGTALNIPFWPAGGHAEKGAATWIVHGIELLPAVTYEELAFRAILLARLRVFTGGKMAGPVLLTAVLFAAMHGYSPLSTGIVFVHGVMYGALFARTNRLARVVIGHWLYDLV